MSIYRTSSKVAIKRIHKIFDELMDAKHVYREMHILRQLDHRNIVRIRDIVCPNLDLDNPILLPYLNKDDETIMSLKRSRSGSLVEDIKELNELYLVFDFVDTDLYKLILSAQYLSTVHIKAFMYQLMIGLKYIHSANVVHRDIKPANILVNEDCSLKICDFGLSRVIGKERGDSVYESKSSANSSTGSLNNSVDGGSSPSKKTLKPKSLKRQLTRHVVTRWYRAPELILLQEYSCAVDVWSAGCIFAELLGMQIESVKDHHDRVALFPGKSCYPLSNDTLDKVENNKSVQDDRNRVDQLSVIFDIIGSPVADDIEQIPDATTREFLRKLPEKKPTKFKDMYPGADEGALELLHLMLQFNPRKRVTVDQTLDHPFFSDIRNPVLETVADRPMSVDIETLGESSENLRTNVLLELAWHNSR